MSKYTAYYANLTGRLTQLCTVLVLATGVLSGCAVNPVTGERELTLVSDAQAIAIGEQQYAPAQQMQGGEYAVDEALSEYVNEVGQKVAAASGVPLPYEFVVLDQSVPNAWALPGGKIAINRGLLSEMNSEAELAAVLGHEVAHAAARHGAQRMERGLITQGLVLGSMIAVGGGELGVLTMQGAQLAAGLMTQKYSRDAEREADYYGTRFMAKAGYDPQAAVDLQETFVRLSKGRTAKSAGFLEGLFASHPPSTERVENNKRLVKELRADGFNQGQLGRDVYAARLSSLRAAQPAFAAFDEAQKSYADKDLDAALASVNQALKLDFEQPSFHALRGAIRYQQSRYADAITNFDRAVNRDDGYFVYYLQRGLTHKKAKNPNSAKSDLDRSVQLLPTSVAYNALGEIAESEGNMDAARQYYARAGEDKGQAGQAARANLVRVELPQQPNKYIRAAAGRDGSGRYVVQVRNDASVGVRNVILQVEADLGGRVITRNVRFAELGPGQTATSLLGAQFQQAIAVRAYPARAEVAQ